MSKLRDQNVHPTAAFAKKEIVVALPTAISQTGRVAFKYTPGYKFDVIRIRTSNAVKAGAVTGKVKVGTRTASDITFTSGAEVGQTLSSTEADLEGSASEALSVEYTSDGSGVLTNGQVVIEIRAHATRS